MHFGMSSKPRRQRTEVQYRFGASDLSSSSSDDIVHDYRSRSAPTPARPRTTSNPRSRTLVAVSPGRPDRARRFSRRSPATACRLLDDNQFFENFFPSSRRLTVERPVRWPVRRSTRTLVLGDLVLISTAVGGT